LSIVPKNGSDILTYGFSKQRANESTWFDFLLPIGIALILTIIVRRYMPRIFG
jgi:hypothetical protein